MYASTLRTHSYKLAHVMPPYSAHPRFQISDLVSPAEPRFQISDFRFQISCRQQKPDFRFRISDFRFQPSVGHALRAEAGIQIPQYWFHISAGNTWWTASSKILNVKSEIWNLKSEIWNLISEIWVGLAIRKCIASGTQISDFRFQITCRQRNPDVRFSDFVSSRF